MLYRNVMYTQHIQYSCNKFDTSRNEHGYLGEGGLYPMPKDSHPHSHHVPLVTVGMVAKFIYQLVNDL